MYWLSQRLRPWSTTLHTADTWLQSSPSKVGDAYHKQPQGSTEGVGELGMNSKDNIFILNISKAKEMDVHFCKTGIGHLL